jgi:preprotein translocase subunit Sss1
MLLGAAVGFGDIMELSRVIRATDSPRKDLSSVLFVAARGLVFIGLLLTFLSLEIRVIANMLQ